MKKQKTKSPIKFDPLHNPGQSLEEQIQNFAYDKILPTIIYPVVFSVLAWVEWQWYLHPRSVPPYLSTAAAGVFILLALIRLPRYWKMMKQMRQGQKGEQAVGLFLEELRRYGYEVIHDIVGDGFNVDHIVLSERGIFVIETKTYSKPAHGDVKITCHDGELLVNGFKPDRNPIRQARILAKWVSEVLKDSSGHQFPIKPVVVFPGWFVDPLCNRDRSDVWVLNPKALEKFILKQSECIPADMVRLASKHLKSYVRMQEKNKPKGKN